MSKTSKQLNQIAKKLDLSIETKILVDTIRSLGLQEMADSIASKGLPFVVLGKGDTGYEWHIANEDPVDIDWDEWWHTDPIVYREFTRFPQPKQDEVIYYVVRAVEAFCEKVIAKITEKAIEEGVLK